MKTSKHTTFTKAFYEKDIVLEDIRTAVGERLLHADTETSDIYHSVADFDFLLNSALKSTTGLLPKNATPPLDIAQDFESPFGFAHIQALHKALDSEKGFNAKKGIGIRILLDAINDVTLRMWPEEIVQAKIPQPTNQLTAKDWMNSPFPSHFMTPDTLAANLGVLRTNRPLVAMFVKLRELAQQAAYGGQQKVDGSFTLELPEGNINFGVFKKPPRNVISYGFGPDDETQAALKALFKTFLQPDKNVNAMHTAAIGSKPPNARLITNAEAVGLQEATGREETIRR